MDSQSTAPWLTATWWHEDDISTCQVDDSWLTGLDGTSHSADDGFGLPPAVDSLSSYYGLDSIGGFSLSPEAAMTNDSPSLFGFVDDEESMTTPPISPTISMAYPSPSTSSGSDNGASYDSVKTSTKSARTTSSKTRTGGSARKSSSKSSRKSSTSDCIGDPKLQRARTCHNVVEKNYRNRLNGQFELMLATLNESRARTGEMDSFGTDYDRAPSKSAVLQLAREKLISLERENQSLRDEVGRLRDSFQSEFSYARTALV